MWLWRRPVATAPIQPLAWEPPYAAGAAQEIANKKKKNKKKKKKKKKKRKKNQLKYNTKESHQNTRGENKTRREEKRATKTNPEQLIKWQ